MVAGVFGLGLRNRHHKYVLQNKPNVDFFEVHTENFICEGGPSLDFLEKISKYYKLSFHCVGLSLGSASGLDRAHLQNIKKLVDKFNPFLFSDHLSWSNSPVGTSNDLLPIPYTKEALEIFCKNIAHVQDFFGRNILVENPSAYLEYDISEIPEPDFLNEVVSRTNCDLLLDINNVYVSSKNFGFDPHEYLRTINCGKVKEIHLAGHSIYNYQGSEIRIDTHSTNVCDDVLALYKNFVTETKTRVPTLIEWDEDIPEFEILYRELEKVKSFVVYET